MGNSVGVLNSLAREAAATNHPMPVRRSFLPGAGESMPLTDAPFDANFARRFPDGKRVAIVGHEPDYGIRVYFQNLADGKMKPLSLEGVGLASAGITPDGKYVTGISPDLKPVLCALERGQCTAIQGVDISIQWSNDGRTRFVARSGEIPCRIFDVQTGKRTLWKTVMPNDPAGITAISPVIMTPDTKYYIYGYTRFLSDLYVVDGLMSSLTTTPYRPRPKRSFHRAHASLRALRLGSLASGASPARIKP